MARLSIARDCFAGTVACAIAVLLAFIFSQAGICQEDSGADKFYLRRDKKLYAKLSIEATDPPLADLIPQLCAATGLNITLAENLTGHQPKLGAVRMANAHAWSFMQLIQRVDMDGGRWEKTPDGYMLTGTSKGLAIPPSRFPWAWLAIGVALTLMAAGGFVMYRSRASKSAAKE